jgi:hypothetical protein
LAQGAGLDQRGLGQRLGRGLVKGLVKGSVEVRPMVGQCLAALVPGRPKPQAWPGVCTRVALPPSKQLPTPTTVGPNPQPPGPH